MTLLPKHDPDMTQPKHCLRPRRSALAASRPPLPLRAAVTRVHPSPPAPAPGCPFCRKVREAVAILDLDVLVLPCPKDGPTWRPEAVQKGGKRMVRRQTQLFPSP